MYLVLFMGVPTSELDMLVIRVYGGVFMVFTSQGRSPRDANTIKTTYTLITDLNHVLLK